jgi:glutamate synthase domain-containing protein 3
MARAATDEKASMKTITLDATGIYYRDLNTRIRELIKDGYRQITLDGVNGQRYIGDGLMDKVKIVINGVPGNDLGAFMDGPTLVVNDNAQDGVGNTMNSGKIVVKGHAGDVLGYGMRGGKVFVTGNVGYRVGIHMKSYKEQVPVIVAGGSAGDFFGEYMAGGVMVLLGVSGEEGPLTGNYLGTGMHGGVIFLRGQVAMHQLGSEVREYALDDEDGCMLEAILQEYAADTGSNLSGISPGDFVKLQPFSHRPYGNMYCY